MQLDLRTDFTEILAFIVERVTAYDPEVVAGPGKGGAVSQIDLGFDFVDSGWVSLIFDTRADAEPDGEWTLHIEGNALERPHWARAANAAENGELTLIQTDGAEKVLELPEPAENGDEGEEDNPMAVALGDLLKEVLLKARADGLFEKLPKTENCMLGVEHIRGEYGWPEYDLRGEGNLATLES